MTSSWEALVMCDEYIGAAKRVARGFEINDDTLALDLIEQRGPEGHFLAETHTVEHYRKEFWMPGLMDRDSFQAWEMNGKTTLLERANAKIRQILEDHKPQELDRNLLMSLEEIMKKDNS